MKLIIDIPEKDYKNVSRIVDMGLGTNVDEAIKNGTPLDDVKALVEYNAEIHEDGERYLMEQWVYDILDGKYKVESEKIR